MYKTPLARVSLLLLLSLAFTINAATFTSPKREMRSSWTVTAWGLDWPKNLITTSGNATQINKQKTELTRILDSLKVNNFNSFTIQVRSMCDAIYKSSYEPWSSYLSGTRGLDPGYDPLAFAVEECHKRGMECYAWVNPYRFSTGGDWQTSLDKALRNSGILLSYTSSQQTTIILDPARKESVQRILNVCKEIITNYDVDGLAFDDYFYPDGIPSDSTAGDYKEWQNSGTTMTLGDWRRQNVNDMVQAVYNMIQQTKPYVRFGMSPAGEICTTSEMADKYGLEICKSGYDWQYDGIFSEPLAWLKNKTLDYIAPQVYWTIGFSTEDYSIIAPWWIKAAAKFGRHCCVAHSITSLTSSSSGTLAPRKAYGPNSTSYDEFVNEVGINRNNDTQGAPGSIFYSARFVGCLNAPESFGHYLHRTVFTKPALTPAMTWKPGNNPGVVQNLALTDNVLSWQGYDNVRYTIYAVPDSVPQSSFTNDGKYLIATSYATSYTIPDAYRTGYQYAVCVLDRMGYEYSPVFSGATVTNLDAPQLVAPATGSNVTDPFDFSWKPVAGATGYIIEIASDADFKNLKNTITTTDTLISSAKIEDLASQVTQYWRVRAYAPNHNDGISVQRDFTPQVLTITYPADGETGVEPSFTSRWTATDTAYNGTLEIATNKNFYKSSIVYTGTSRSGSLLIPEYNLNAGTAYFARITMSRDSTSKTSQPVAFTTKYMTATVPVLVTPTAGSTLYRDQYPQIERQAGATSYVIEISSSPTVWGRTRFVETIKNPASKTTKPAGEIKVNSQLLVDGNTYYARAHATYINENGTTTSTDYSDPIAFIYSANSGVNGINTSSNMTSIVGGENPTLIVKTPSTGSITVSVYNMQGGLETVLYNGKSSYLTLPLTSLAHGAHLIVVNINGRTETLKLAR
jgi:uncharacterized lipoprotein YddW (UPF0748 family)